MDVYDLPAGIHNPLAKKASLKADRQDIPDFTRGKWKTANICTK
jgi:hypothetical protein